VDSGERLALVGWWWREPLRKSAKGVWDWMKFFVVRGVGRAKALEMSATRSDSCLPPPLVRRMKGMWWFWR
jgi:hypothetical protein